MIEIIIYNYWFQNHPNTVYWDQTAAIRIRHQLNQWKL